MIIEELEINNLKPYDKNSKLHPKKQIDLLKKNINEFSFTTPILIDKDNEIIAGHGRLIAIKELKWAKVPCVRMENLTDKQIKALRLADNKLNESDWDMELVIEELEELPKDLFELTGFEAKDLENYDEDSFSEKNKEIDEEELGEFKHKCPKCGFIFNEDV